MNFFYEYSPHFFAEKTGWQFVFKISNIYYRVYKILQEKCILRLLTDSIEIHHFPTILFSVLKFQMTAE